MIAIAISLSSIIALIYIGIWVFEKFKRYLSTLEKYFLFSLPISGLLWYTLIDWILDMEHSILVSSLNWSIVWKLIFIGLFSIISFGSFVGVVFAFLLPFKEGVLKYMEVSDDQIGMNGLLLIVTLVLGIVAFIANVLILLVC